MARATHIDYLHKRHLRVVEGNGQVLCYAPSVSNYSELTKKKLPVWRGKE